MSDRRLDDGPWKPFRTRFVCERHLIFGDVHCGRTARWKHKTTGRIACGTCKALSVRGDS